MRPMVVSLGQVAAKRNSIRKYEGWPCPMPEFCNAGKTYGKAVRVPRATKKFEQRYKGRTSVERVNTRLKIFWGEDDGNVKRSCCFHAWVGAVLAVHAPSRRSWPVRLADKLPGQAHAMIDMSYHFDNLTCGSPPNERTAPWPSSTSPKLAHICAGLCEPFRFGRTTKSKRSSWQIFFRRWRIAL